MEIGNFIVTEKDNRTCISYKRPVKEWLDIVFLLAVGIGATVFIVLMYFQTYYHQWVFWLLAGLFSILAWVKTADGVSRLREPTGDLIVIDPTEKQLITKWGNRKGTRYDFANIKEVVLLGSTEEDLSEKMRGSHRIEIMTHDGEGKTIAIIHTRKAFGRNQPELIAHRDRIGQELVNVIADRICV